MSMTDDDQTQGIPDTSSPADAPAPSGGIDTSGSPTDDNSGAAPVVATPQPPADNSGAAPVVASPEQAAPQQPGQQGSDALGDIAKAGQQPLGQALQQFPGNAKRIASLLMGADAAPPDVLDQGKQSVDPQGAQPDGNKNLLAIDAAFKKGGTAAAWPILQANRVSFNAKQAFAYTALTGTQQKPPDMNAAIDAANQAEQHVLDGSNVRFAPSQGGVTATVTTNAGQPTQINLTPDQFKQYLDVGGAGQWDALMNKTVPATLQAIAGGGAGDTGASAPAPAAAAAGSPPQPAPQKGWGAAPTQAPPQPNQPQVMPKPQTSYGHTPSTMNLSGSEDANPEPQAPVDTDDDAKDKRLISERAQRIFPMASQTAQREQWMAAQEEQGANRANQVEVAAEKGRRGLEIAKATGTGRVQQEQVKADARVQSANISADARKYVGDASANARRSAVQAELQKRASIEKNSQQRNAAALLGHQLQNIALLSSDEQAKLTKNVDAFLTAGAPGAPPQQQAPAPQAPQPQAQNNDVHAQAIAWARANPTDPRAAQILKKNGVQ